MASPWKKQQPEVVADAVLKRAEVGKIGRKLKTRLAFAQFKAARGWEDLSIDAIEPKVEELRRARPVSSGDVLSDTSSSTSASDVRYSNSRDLMNSPLKDSVIFSEQLQPRSGSRNYRKRSYHDSFQDSGFSTSSRKQYHSSPTFDRSMSGSSAAFRNHQLTQSSPIKPCKYFTTASGPSLSFYGGAQHTARNHLSDCHFSSDDEDESLPVHSFNISSSPPRTPPPLRTRGGFGCRPKERNGKPGEEGADLLLYLATSPSPAHPTRDRMHPPSTPPAKSLALPSSMMTTPRGGVDLMSVFGGPSTPSQAFDFSDFVNITPSPAQPVWPRTPRTGRTPSATARLHLNLDRFSSPNSRDR